MRHALTLRTLLMVLLSACSCGDDPTDSSDVTDDDPMDAPGVDMSTPNDGATVDASGDDDDGGESMGDFCDGEGPLIIVGDDTSTEMDCAGRIAERSFRYALCTCEGLVTSHELSTDSFDSDMGPYVPPGGVGGSVGTNGGGNSTADWDVGGSLWSSGSTGWTVSSELAIGSELHLTGRLAGSEVSVGADAWVGGGIGLDTLTVEGTLTVPDPDAVVVDSLSTGGDATGVVEVADPCACGEDAIVDVASFVAGYAVDNDNAAIALSADALANVSTETTLELPCGRFYLDSVSATAPLTIRVTGRVALFVGGSITANDTFEVIPEGDAEVDVFVGGNVTGAGAFSVGTADAPARARLYVGGNGTVNLSASTTFAGNLYAPRAELVTAGDVEIFGAAFVRRLSAAGSVDIHYDTAILEAGDDCDIPDTCSMCGDCPSVQACIDGVCGECRTSADCCSPLICRDGACVPELI
ncbi:MAG: hypothetical protein JJ863_28450 [Deltaproteobacteria bacterium]|nr:hypothetical protein [Deltaproteobacteria bacterium]